MGKDGRFFPKNGSFLPEDHLDVIRHHSQSYVKFSYSFIQMSHTHVIWILRRIRTAFNIIRMHRLIYIS